jgi:uncharacterized protein (TIGR02231 family)
LPALFFQFNGIAEAEPTEVTLFPSSALVRETASLAILSVDAIQKKAVFTLPQQADPESLVASLAVNGKLQIEDVTWRKITQQDEAKIADLRERIQTVKAERYGQAAAIQSLETQIQFWQAQVKARVKNINEAASMASIIGRNMRKAVQEKLAQEPLLEKLDSRIKELEEELSHITGKQDKEWEVTVLMRGPQTGTVSMTYSYTLLDCGWRPMYRIEAKPKANTVQFTWEAEIWQSSGRDWKGVTMHLATLWPQVSIDPPSLQDWIVQPRSKRHQKSLGEARDANAPESFAAAFPMPEEREALSLSRQSTYSIWAIGTRDLTAGAHRRLKVQDSSWPAAFTYLVRPAMSGQAYVRATLQLNEPIEIPFGTAIYLMEGAVLGKRTFSLAGREGMIFFVHDPLVKTKAVLLTSQSGGRTLLADKQTYDWEWRLEVENNHMDGVTVRMEEPRPIVKDKRIKMSFKWEPEPAEQTQSRFIWNLEVPTSGKKSILHGIHLEAPAQMDLDLGWRR